MALNTIKYIVVDECDTLLDESFGGMTCNILSRINVSHQPKILIKNKIENNKRVEKCKKYPI